MKKELSNNCFLMNERFYKLVLCVHTVQSWLRQKKNPYTPRRWKEVQKNNQQRKRTLKGWFTQITTKYTVSLTFNGIQS